MLNSNEFPSEKQLTMSENWNWAIYDINMNNNTNHDGNVTDSSTFVSQWNSNIPAYDIVDQTILKNSSNTSNNTVNLCKPAYSHKLYHENQGDIEYIKCLNNFPNSSQIHLPSIGSVRRQTNYDDYNNASYSTCLYNDQRQIYQKTEIILPQITGHSIDQYDTDLRKVNRSSYYDCSINNEVNYINNTDRSVDYLPTINTDPKYLVSTNQSLNSVVKSDQIDQYTLPKCDNLRISIISGLNDGNSNNSNNNDSNNNSKIIQTHKNSNIVSDSNENSNLTIQQHLWDIKDLKLPKVNYYDPYELWPTGHCRRVYAQTCERARRHQSGWAMRNTNNHNPQVLKKSCLGVLECSMGCLVQGKPLSLRPAICDKARKKQCNRECITPGCRGRLILRNCRGHSGYPVTHFWRFANGAVYFEAKGEHDHNRPSLKTFGLSESDTTTLNTMTNVATITTSNATSTTTTQQHQKCEDYFQISPSDSMFTFDNEIKRNSRRNRQNKKSIHYNKLKINHKTDVNQEDYIPCENQYPDTLQRCYPININNDNSWSNQSINQVYMDSNQSMNNQYNHSELSKLQYPYYSDSLHISASLSSSISMNQNNLLLPFENCLQDIETCLSTSQTSSVSYMNNIVVSTTCSSPNWPSSPSVLSSSSSSSCTSSSSLSLSSSSMPSSSTSSLCPTNLSTSMSNYILPNPIDSCQSNSTISYQATNNTHLDENQSYFMDQNTCSFSSIHNATISCNDYSQSAIIIKSITDGEHDDPSIPFINDNEIYERIGHSTPFIIKPQQSTYWNYAIHPTNIGRHHYYYYYQHHHHSDQPWMSMIDHVSLSNPVTTTDNNNNNTYLTESYHLNNQHQQIVQCSINETVHPVEQRSFNESYMRGENDVHDAEKSLNYCHFILDSNSNREINVNYCYLNQSNEHRTLKEANNNDVDSEDSLQDDKDKVLADQQCHHHLHHHQQQQQQQHHEFAFDENLLDTINWSNQYSRNSSSMRQINPLEQELIIESVNANFEGCLSMTNTTNVATTNNTYNEASSYPVNHNFPCHLQKFDESMNYYTTTNDFNGPITVTFDNLLINNSQF
ncbi:hypothetical protein MN116_008131 [Schistosoma mekongi]|uniref:GCM domain-containing protein n=1 Tax=Schistosoma mekongi TaxID=38744 RepID=A0AAE1Z685_SCHME|nr:hypothetical protein MN116_008131 [Schistosoma mekongi]